MRKENWPHLLAEKIAASHDRKFEYGTFDCCLFVAECIEEITGVDHAEKFCGYSSKEEAYKIIECFGSFEAMISSILAKEPKPISFAQRGDVVLAIVPTESGKEVEAVGICHGIHSWFVAPQGLRPFRTLSAKLAWSIV